MKPPASPPSSSLPRRGFLAGAAALGASALTGVSSSAAEPAVSHLGPMLGHADDKALTADLVAFRQSDRAGDEMLERLRLGVIVALVAGLLLGGILAEGNRVLCQGRRR